jgi:nucleoside-diphosphate-sugar epimerase
MLGRSEPPRSYSTPVAVFLAESARLGHRVAGRRTELGRGVMEMLAKTRPVSNTKAHEVLGWSPTVDLDEGMARTEAWLRAQGFLDANEARC